MANPYVNYRELATASYAGDARLIIWTLAWDNHAVLNRLPLFDSNIFYPTSGSLAYTEHLFGISLFTLPVYIATRNPVLAYNVVWLLSFLFGGLAAHAWLKRLTGRDAAAAVGSLIFTFSFYKMLHGHGHLQQIWTWLIPVSLVCLDRWGDRPSLGRASVWGLAVVLQSLASWYVALMMLLIHATAVPVLIPRLRKHGRLSSLWHLLLVTVVAAAIVWPFAAPYRALPATDVREIASNSADLRAYLVPPENTWTGQWWLARGGSGPRWIWGERTLFIGWLALALSAIGTFELWRLRKLETLAFAGVMTILGFTLSLGPALTRTGESWSLFSALMSIPGIGAFRAPARFALLVLLGVSVLGAFGMLALRRLPRSGLVLAAVVPAMLGEWHVVAFPGGKPQTLPVPAIYRAEAIANARAIASLPSYRGTRDWYFEPDYLYFSTVHWRPIVNGYGRTDPPEHPHTVSHLLAFPGPNNARTMRTLGVDGIVVHAARYPDGGRELLAAALGSPEYRLVSRVGTDYLFAVLPAPDSSR
jgi:hypothetical protein